MSLAKEIYRLKSTPAGPFTDGVTRANALLPAAGRFRVDDTVMKAVERMERTPFADLLGALDQARLPFPVTWIEWPSLGGGHLGYLVEQARGEIGFAFRQYLYAEGMERATGHRVICGLGRVVVEPAGHHCENPAEAATSGSVLGRDPHELAAADLLGMLLIINSPSRVVVIDEAPDTSRVDARRVRQGRMPLPNLRPIRLDFGRLRQIDVEDGTERADGDASAEHFVRGHFKFRHRRMHWWSPHIRNQAAHEPAAMPRDYHVVRSNLD